MLRGEDGQQEDINESTDKEAKESGMEDDCEEIDSSGDDKSEEGIVLPELSSEPNSEHDATSGKQEYYSIDKVTR